MLSNFVYFGILFGFQTVQLSRTAGDWRKGPFLNTAMSFTVP